jgi:hypothetical protein
MEDAKCSALRVNKENELLFFFMYGKGAKT